MNKILNFDPTHSHYKNSIAGKQGIKLLSPMREIEWVIKIYIRCQPLWYISCKRDSSSRFPKMSIFSASPGCSPICRVSVGNSSLANSHQIIWRKRFKSVNWGEKSRKKEKGATRWSMTYPAWALTIRNTGKAKNMVRFIIPTDDYGEILTMVQLFTILWQYVTVAPNKQFYELSICWSRPWWHPSACLVIRTLIIRVTDVKFE